MNARIGAAALLVGALGCTFNPKLPDDPRIACASDADCPLADGVPVECAITSGFCVFDPGPVRLDQLSLEPPVARAGVELELRFVVEEGLRRPPRVVPAWTGQPLDADPASSPATGEWIYRYVVEGTEPADAPQAIDIEVEGVGERLRDVVNARFDFQPPAAAIVVVGNALSFGVRAGGELELLITGLEPDDAEVEGSLRLVSGDEEFAPVEVSRAQIGSDLELSLRLPTTLPAAVVDGSALVVELEVADAAGNTQTLRTAPVVVDLRPPFATVNLPPSVATPDVTVSLADLDAVSVRLEGDVVAPLGEQAAATSIPAQLEPTPGLKTVNVHLTDGAGNTAVIPAQTVLEDGVFVTLTISAPAGKTAAQPAEQLTFSGVAALGATLESVSASLDAEALDNPGLSIENGVVTGTFAAPPDEGDLRVDVVVERDGQTASASAEIRVDATPPAFNLSFPEGATSASPEGRLAITTDDNDIERVLLRGDLVAVRRNGQSLPIDTPIAFANSFDLTFTDGDGVKSVEVVAFDEAGFEVQQNASFTVDADLVDSNPSLGAAPVGAGAVVNISGSVSPLGATVVSARALYGGASCRVEPVTVSLSNDRLGGSLTVPTDLEPCASDLVLEVIVEFGGVESDPANSRSPPIVVDDDPPAGGPPTLTGLQIGDAGVTRAAAITVAVSATEVSAGGTFKILPSSDVEPGPSVDTPIPLIVGVGADTVIGSASVTLTSGDGAKTVDVTLTDSLGNTSEVRSATIVLDTTPPAPVALGALRLTESAPGDAFDPLILDANNVVEVEGLPGAANGAYELKVLNGLGGIASALVQANGAAAPFTLGADPNHQYTVRALDAAGNAAEVVAQLPRATSINFNPDLPSTAAPFTVSVSSTPGFASATVAIEGTAAAPVTINSFEFTPVGDEPQLPQLSVLRGTLAPLLGSFANGSASSQAVTVSFDFTPPSLVDVVPGGAPIFNGQGELSGTASDNDVVAAVRGQVLELSSGLYWDPVGGGFTSSDVVAFDAAGTADWSLPGLTFNSGDYEVTVSAVDGAGNIGTLEYTFTFDNGGVAPVNLVADSPSPQRIVLRWVAPAGGVDQYQLSWVPDSGGPVPPAAEGPSPIDIDPTALSTTLTDLPRGGYTITLTGVRLPSTTGDAVVPAASRETADVLIGEAPLTALAADRAGNAVACFENEVRYSADGGRSWATAALPGACTHAAVHAGVAVLAADDGSTGRLNVATGALENLGPAGVNAVAAVGIDSSGGVVVAGATQFAHRAVGEAGWTVPEIPVSLVDIRSSGDRMAAAGTSGADGVVYLSSSGVSGLAERFRRAGAPLNQVALDDPTNIILTCGESMLRSDNGGGSFSLVTLPAPIACDTLDLLGERAAVAGDGRLMTSENGGADWEANGSDIGFSPELSLDGSGSLCLALTGPDLSCFFPDGRAATLADPVVERSFRFVRFFTQGTALMAGNDGATGLGVVKQYGP